MAVRRAFISEFRLHGARAPPLVEYDPSASRVAPFRPVLTCERPGYGPSKVESFIARVAHAPEGADDDDLADVRTP